MSRGVDTNTTGWTTHSTELVHENPWFRVRRDRVTFPSGADGVYHVVEKQASVVVVPITPSGDVIMLRSYRYPIDRVCWELPAGSIEAGQSPLDAALSELSEEVGGTADHVEEVGKTFLANGFARYAMHAVVARGVVLADAPRREASEDIRTVEAVSLAIAKQRLLAPEQDGDSALALLMADSRGIGSNQGETRQH